MEYLIVAGVILLIMFMVASQGSKKRLPTKSEINGFLNGVYYYREGRSSKRNYDGWLKALPGLIRRIREAIDDKSDLKWYVDELEKALESKDVEKIFRALRNLYAAYPEV